MGLIGMMVRWYESYLISPDVGHIPISNLYEVFILFSIITSLLYLHYERLYNNRQMGAFVLPVISAAVGFLLWYAYTRQATGNSALGAGAAILLDENPCPSQLHWLWFVFACCDGGHCVSASFQRHTRLAFAETGSA